MEEAAVILMSNPDADGLGKAKSSIKEKPLSASRGCAAHGAAHAASFDSAGPLSTVKLQPPRLGQAVTLARRAVSEHPSLMAVPPKQLNPFFSRQSTRKENGCCVLPSSSKNSLTSVVNLSKSNGQTLLQVSWDCPFLTVCKP